MPTVFELDQVTVRARTESAVLRSREYDLLDPSGVAVASATQDAGSPPTMARRWLATSAKANMSTDFDLRDPSGMRLAHVAKRVSGLRSQLTAEVRLADSALVAVATASAGARRFQVVDEAGSPLADLARAGRTLLAVTGPAGERWGTVDLEANTLSARRAGTAHPNSYLVRFEPSAPGPVRIATLAMVLVVDSLR